MSEAKITTEEPDGPQNRIVLVVTRPQRQGPPRVRRLFLTFDETRDVILRLQEAMAEHGQAVPGQEV